MNLQRWVTKAVALICMVAFFCSFGCAPLRQNIGAGSPLRSTVTIPSTPQIIVAPEPAKQLRKEILRRGAPAPADGIWFDKEAAKIILADLAELRQIKAKVQIQEQIIGAYTQQVQLLREANNLQAAANDQLSKEIRNKRKWDTVKSVTSIVAAVAAFALGIWSAQ